MNDLTTEDLIALKEYDRVASIYKFLTDELRVIHSELFEIDTSVTIGECLELMKVYQNIVYGRDSYFGSSKS